MTLTKICRCHSFIALIVWGNFSFADMGPYFPVKTVVEILDYKQDLNIYIVGAWKFNGQGPLYVTPNELVKGIPILNLGRLRRDPAAIISNQYQIDKDMALMNADMMEAYRKAKIRRAAMLAQKLLPRYQKSIWAPASESKPSPSKYLPK